MSSTQKKVPTLLSENLISTAQTAAIDRLFSFDETLLVGKMGCGKTLVALTAIKELLDEQFLARILVIAPLKVAKNVWRQEAEKWGHTAVLRVNAAIGNEKERRSVIDNQDNQVVVINFENVVWFFETYGRDHNFDGLLIDELSKLKKTGGQQFKALRRRLKDF